MDAFKNLPMDEKLDKLYSTLLFEIENNGKRHYELSVTFEKLKADVTNNLQTFSDKIKILEGNIGAVKNNEAVTVKRLDAIDYAVNNLKQIGMCTDMVINGIVEVEQNRDELLSLVYTVLRQINCDKPYTVYSAFRIGKAAVNGNKNRSVLVKLSSKVERNMILSAKRKVKITADKILFKNKPLGTADNIIYINESLTKLNADIYFAALKLKKANIVKYIWLRNGSTFLKENDSSAVTRISSIEQLKSFSRGKRKFNSTPIDLNESIDPNSSPPPMQEDKRLKDGSTTPA